MTAPLVRLHATSLVAMLSCTSAGASEATYQGALARPLCLTRNYTQEHLTKHPQQVVTSIRIQLSKHPTGTSDKPFRMHFAATVRNRSERLKTVADCDLKRLTSSPELYLECNVECDGGGVAIKLGDEGRQGLVYLGTPLGRGTISLPAACGSATSDSYSLDAGLDDHTFRVFAGKESECYLFQDHSVPWRE